MQIERSLPINAYPGSATAGIIMPYRIEPCGQQVFWGNHSVKFVFSDSALRVELPHELRPVMKLACGRFVEVAKAGLDSRGVAYLWSEDGEMLASMPPVHLHDDLLASGEQMQLLHAKKIHINGPAMIASAMQSACPYYKEDGLLSVQDANSTQSWQGNCNVVDLEECSDCSSTAAPDSPECDMDTD
jgi:hypothetical protein